MHLTIDGKYIECREGETILQAARKNCIDIPTLCYHPMLEPEGRCRACLVEANGKIVTSCDTAVQGGMHIITDSEKLRRMRRDAVDLIASSVSPETIKEENELTDAMKKAGLEKPSFKNYKKLAKDNSSNAVWRNNNRCIACGRCVQSCSSVQSVDAITFAGRSNEMQVEGVEGEPLAKTACVSCGQCSLVCPTNAITEASEVKKVEKALKEKGKLKVVQIAPSVRVSLGECLGMEPGRIVTGKIVAALKKAGFDVVFDTNFSADLTIVEESNEFVERVKGGKTPLFTSCCPAWIDFCCQFYPEFIPKISTAKSPQQMMGAMIKTFYAGKRGIRPGKITSVSVMPCTAKKKEARLKQMRASGVQDIDFVLTTRELAMLFKKKGIGLEKMSESEFDDPLGESTGAGAIFGVTGGVMEAALRTAYFLIEGKELEDINLKMTRGTKGLKEFEIEIKGEKFRAAVAHGLANARLLLERIKKGEHFHFVEVRACPGGCIGGGGQPKLTDWGKISARAEAIYAVDSGKGQRKSHENAAVKKAYAEFLGKPGSEKAKGLLHRSYPEKGKAE
ncbi:MAG: [FeFe] hydrogenase, group A [Candidatus Diapherotrites archaeon]|nr:[FeFe] hydrogenase, group A [Candidatus Diapherotrites archaeon]